jgi:hypothetical protein
MAVENSLVLERSIPTEIDHSKTRLAWFSDVYCICFLNHRSLSFGAQLVPSLTLFKTLKEDPLFTSEL